MFYLLIFYIVNNEAKESSFEEPYPKEQVEEPNNKLFQLDGNILSAEEQEDIDDRVVERYNQEILGECY